MPTIDPALTARYERLGRLVHAWVVAMRGVDLPDDVSRIVESTAEMWRVARGWYRLALDAADDAQASRDAREAVRLMESAARAAVRATELWRRQNSLRDLIMSPTAPLVLAMGAGRWAASVAADAADTVVEGAGAAVEAAGELAAEVARPAIWTIRVGLAVAVGLGGLWLWRRIR